MSSAQKSEGLSASLKNIKHNKLAVGSTRSDLLQLFTPAGGISSRLSGTFAYKQDLQIKVDVRFALAKGHEEDWAKYAPEDVIAEMSDLRTDTSVID